MPGKNGTLPTAVRVEPQPTLALQDFTSDEQSCISRLISEKTAAGQQASDQDIAVAISECAPEKAKQRAAESGGVLRLSLDEVMALCPECAEEMERRGLSALKLNLAQATSAPPIPGGKFRATQASDGSWTIHDVPIFAEHKVETGEGVLHVDEQWMGRAIRRSRARESDDGYLPPLHVNHHGTGRQVRRAGFFRPTSVRSKRYEGKELAVLFADLVGVPQEVFEEIERGELPYRSVEVHRLDKPEVDSLALMADEVPFFRLSLLTIGEKRPHDGFVGEPHHLSETAAPAMAYRSVGDAYLLLSDFRQMETPMKPRRFQDDEYEKRPDEMMMEEDDDRDVQVVVEDDPEAPPMEEKMQAGGGPADRLAAIAADLQSLAEEMAGGAEEGMAEAPEPVDIQARSSRTNGRRYSERDRRIKAQAEKDILRDQVRKLQARQDLDDTLAEVASNLERAGHDPSLYANRLRRIAKEDGISGVKVYAQAILDQVDPDPPASLEEFERMGGSGVYADPSVANYAAQGSQAVKYAADLAKEYDQLKAQGRRLSFDKASFIRNEMDRAGFGKEG